MSGTLKPFKNGLIYTTSPKFSIGIMKLNIYNMNEKEFAMNIADSFKVLVQCTEAEAFSVQADNQD